MTVGEHSVGGVAGILLTGGKSLRMGFDKASLVFDDDDLTLAARLGAALRAVTESAVEVGPGVSGLSSIEEVPAGAGPLVAVSAGVRALRQRGHDGAALVVACDLPFMTLSVLRLIARWPAPGSLVPLVAERPQPLCARWSAPDLDIAIELVANGQRSMRALLDRSRPMFVVASDADGLPPLAFADVDTKEDLSRLGIPLPRGHA